MNGPISIRRRITKYSILGLAALVLFSCLAIVGQGLWKRHQEIEKHEMAMLATGTKQARRILGTLLLPEERAALPMILDQIKKSENLSGISLNQFGRFRNEIPKSCRMLTDADLICSGRFDSEIKTATLIKSSAQIYGLLEKTKLLEDLGWVSFADPQVLLLIFSALVLIGILLLIANFIQKELDEKSRKEALGEMARQVAHDLRSPLSLLNVVTAESDHPMTDTEKRLAKQAVARIEQISDSLLRKSETLKQNLSTAQLAETLKNLVAEKAHQNRGRVQLIFDNSICEHFELDMDPESLMRTLSNLLDNSVEAIEGQGSVRISLSSDKDQNVFIDILDTGVGLNGQLTEGKSTKTKGHGLGVQAARKELDRQNGELKYDSLEGTGTLTRIKLA